ncbi:MAG: hypothetical protein ACRDMJ_17785, partial [Solirubrobacteraceae bacterium]
ADVAISDVDVHVIDGDLPGLIAAVPPTGLNVVEGSATVVGTYMLALTTAPASGETVTVTLISTDTRLRFSGPLVFDSADWSTPQTVTITAIDDGIVEGENIDTITATVTSSEPSGGVYSNGVVDNPTEQINVYDGDSGGVLVLPSTGTLVVGPAGNSYTIQLTRAPAAGDTVTVTILSDGKTLVSSADSRFSATGGANGLPSVTFDASDWNVPITIDVTANPNAPAVVGTQPVQVFPAEPQTTSGIYGPLVIEGDETTPRSLVAAVILPSEIDAPLPPPPPAQSDSSKVDTLNVFDDGSAAPYDGHLGAITAQELASLQTLYAPSLAAGLQQSQFGEIDGLGMGGAVTFNRGPVSGLTFAGGITYHNVDVVDVMLGSRAPSAATESTFTVSATVQNTITVIQGGGGYKKLVATGGGGYFSPLILLGNTTQDGSFYDSTTGAITGEARVYQDPGKSVIDASLDPNGVIIYGGVGDSQIYGGGGGDQIFGGSGADIIEAGSGNDIIHADDGINLDLTHTIAQDIAGNLNALQAVSDPSPTDTPQAYPDRDPLLATSDQIYAGIGHDIIILDHGVVDQLDNPITGTGGVIDAYTVDPITFGLSSVFGAYNGTAVVLAGSGQQTIDLGHTKNSNVIVKNGYVYFAGPDSWVGKLAKVGSTDAGAGGRDTIVTGDGNDVIVAGTGFDRITGGDGNKIVLGDDGQITWKGGALTEIVSQDPNVSLNSADANTITLGNGNDVVFGGSGANTITLGTGHDIVVGANGELDFAAGAPATLQSIFPGQGGPNVITVGGADGVVIGGPGQNTIVVGPGAVGASNAVVFGVGSASFDASTGLWSVVSPAPAPATGTGVVAPPTVITSLAPPATPSLTTTIKPATHHKHKRHKPKRKHRKPSRHHHKPHRSKHRGKPRSHRHGHSAHGRSHPRRRTH